MENCKNCIHNKVCVINAFPELFENTLWKEECCVYFRYNESLSDRLKQEFRSYVSAENNSTSYNSAVINEFADRLCEGRVSNDPVVIAAKCLLKEMTEGNHESQST